MSILGLKKNTKEKKVEKKEVVVTKLPAVKKIAKKDILNVSADIILKPHLTEKAYNLQANGVYAFEVSPSATKNEIAKSIKAIYGVDPKSIRIVKIKAKNVIWRGVKGKTCSVKKAYVYLKPGDKIDLA